MKRTATLLSLWLVVLLPAVVAGQSAIVTGGIRGRVMDSTGAAIPAAQVELSERATGATSRHLTDGEGLFSFTALPVGRYSMKITAPGFRTVQVSEVSVQVGETSFSGIRLRPGPASESVDVIASIPQLRTTDSTISTVINRALIEDLPLSGRRYTDLSLLTPNSSPDGQSGLVSFAGEQGGEDTGYANGNGANSFTVDGASATSNYFGNFRGGERVPFVFAESSVQEFQVAVSPYSVAYGGGATGFLNTVTKSGSDLLHGNAFYYNRNSGTGANDAVDKANGIPRPEDVLQQFGAAIGGPIVRQRAWVFFDYEQQRERNPISVINDAFTGLGVTDFGLPDGTALPAPNGPLPVPSTLSTVDPNNPIYLQQVANALYAINSNLGTHSRQRNDLALFSKFDYQPRSGDRLYLSLNLNRFDSPFGEITQTNTPLFGISTLANSYVRDYHASTGWTHAFNSKLLSEFHASFSRDEQSSTPTGIISPSLPSILLSAGDSDEAGTLELGNAGFAGGSTKETQWELAERIDYIRGRHNLKFGVEGNRTHVVDSSFGGFDPDAVRQNGTLGGTYAFSSFTNFAQGIYDTFSQAAGNPNFAFSVPYIGFYGQDSYQLFRRLTLDLGVREDFQVYPQPKENPAFPLTGQFPNRYQRFAPRLGFAWQPLEKTVVRGGFGMFYENLNGLNYRNAVVANGLSSQQSSVLYEIGDPGAPVFPNRVPEQQVFSAASGALPNISIVDPSFRFPYVLQSSLQIEREILPETTLSIGTMWTHGVHLISSSAYDLNLMPPSGTTTYVVCPPGADAPCSGRQVVLPNLDSGLLQEGRINSNFGQINALISPGINNYNSAFIQLQRRFHAGIALQAAYTFSKNMMSEGVDFSNQFDFRNTHAPYLLDQRHRLTVAAILQPFSGKHFESSLMNHLLTNWTVSTVMQFASGRPYAALLDTACTSPTFDPGNCIGDGNGLNDTAFNQTTANSALGINGSGPSPNVGLNSFYGPWTKEVDLALARRFSISDRLNLSFAVQAFNLFNSSNYYVQNGNGANPLQYLPVGDNCGDGASLQQTCYLIPEAGFGRLQVINALNGPRVLQFSARFSF